MAQAFSNSNLPRGRVLDGGPLAEMGADTRADPPWLWPSPFPTLPCGRGLDGGPLADKGLPGRTSLDHRAGGGGGLEAGRPSGEQVIANDHVLIRELLSVHG